MPVAYWAVADYQAACVSVHERPVVPFVESSLALTGALEHRLDGARVRERTRIYEAMSTGAGRPEDEALLLAPFDSAAVR